MEKFPEIISKTINGINEKQKQLEDEKKCYEEAPKRAARMSALRRALKRKGEPIIHSISFQKDFGQTIKNADSMVLTDEEKRKAQEAIEGWAKQRFGIWIQSKDQGKIQFEQQIRPLIIKARHKELSKENKAIVICGERYAVLNEFYKADANALDFFYRLKNESEKEEPKTNNNSKVPLSLDFKMFSRLFENRSRSVAYDGQREREEMLSRLVGTKPIKENKKDSPLKELPPLISNPLEYFLFIHKKIETYRYLITTTEIENGEGKEIILKSAQYDLMIWERQAKEAAIKLKEFIKQAGENVFEELRLKEDEILLAAKEMGVEVIITHELFKSKTHSKEIPNQEASKPKIISWDEINSVEIIDGIKIIFHIKNKKPLEMMPNTMPHCGKIRKGNASYPARWGHLLKLFYNPADITVKRAEKQRVNESVLEFLGLFPKFEKPFRPDGTMVFRLKTERQFNRPQVKRNSRALNG